jgi:choline kinase
MKADALIIAAGSGTRFKEVTQTIPKPLIKVCGLELIDRTILSAFRGGIGQITVITGYRSETLGNYLKYKFPQANCLNNENWNLPNGYSVLCAKGKIRVPFVLLMADHLFDPAILVQLLHTPLENGKCRLAVDYNIDKIPDLADATKVYVRNGKIRNIGKEIKEYNAIDTGIFYCGEAVFQALEQAAAEGRTHLSDGILELAKLGQMEAMDIGNLFWRDIDDEIALKEAESIIKSR